MEEKVPTMNSVSGGKTSSYIAVNYPADYNVFALVRTDDKKCMFPDAKIRQEVSDRIGKEFIGTLEEDAIIYTMLDLEQYIGQKIHWVSGMSFDEVIDRSDKRYLPNKTQRFCTVLMKIDPIKKFWWDNIKKPIETRIGYRANETRRANTMMKRCSIDGYLYDKFIVGKRNGKTNQNKWKEFKYQKPIFPLIEDQIFKDQIEQFWKDKPVRFAYMNNCVGCFHRNEVLLKHMSVRHPKKFDWFVRAEEDTGYGTIKFKTDITYREIKNSLEQLDLFDDDFNDCDSGYCGI